MFDTMSIAKRIKQARIAKNMTQLQLADAMGVSYQAVSNWERGNSMPDISKLADLCTTLGLTVNELLGMEETTTAAVTKAMEKEELTVEELKEVAPMLPPEQVTEFVQKLETMDQKREGKCQWILSKNGGVKVHIGRKHTDKQQERKAGKKMDLSAIMSLAPFLDEAYLGNLVEETETEDLSELVSLAPFLSASSLQKMVARCQGTKDFGTIMSLAPFLDSQTLDALAEELVVDDLWQAVSLAPFLSQSSLDKLVRHCEADDDEDALVSLAPFLSQEALRALADRRRQTE